MLKQYIVTLEPNKNSIIKKEYAYYLYAALLEEASEEFSQQVHENTITPISHFIDLKENKVTWNITLFSHAIEELNEIILSKKQWHIKKDNTVLTVLHIEQSRVGIETFYKQGKELAKQGKVIKLEFVTPTAFKSAGVYQNMPTVRLLVQSLVQRWNGVFLNDPIEEEENITTLALGLRSKEYQLRTVDYGLKKQKIRGFQGRMVLENHMCDSEKELVYALFVFAQYSGIGIKTALGMGGVKNGEKMSY